MQRAEPDGKLWYASHHPDWLMTPPAGTRPAARYPRNKAWLIPILAHCTDADGRPVRGAPPHGPLTQMAQFDAHHTIPGDVAAIREFWAPTRYNRRS
jgi:hypothetical protein